MNSTVAKLHRRSKKGHCIASPLALIQTALFHRDYSVDSTPCFFPSIIGRYALQKQRVINHSP